MLTAIGRLTVNVSRLEWYLSALAQIMAGAGENPAIKQLLVDELNISRVINHIRKLRVLYADSPNSDYNIIFDEIIRESDRIRIFRNNIVHCFHGSMNNAEGWITLHKRRDGTGKSLKVTRDEVNEHAAAAESVSLTAKAMIPHIQSLVDSKPFEERTRDHFDEFSG